MGYRKLHNSNCCAGNRSIRRTKEKAKRKTIIRLLGKEKTDKRTSRNLKEIFNFINHKQNFSGPEIVKNTHMKSAVAYDLINTLESKHIIEKIDEKRSSGRGQTKIYALTTPGKIVSAYVTDDISSLIQALKEILMDEQNPLKRFCLEAFIENYATEIMQALLEHSIRRAESTRKGLNIDNLMFELIQNAFSLAPFSKLEKQIFRKNAELMEKSKHRDFIFQYFKSQMESNFLMFLEGQKLKEYADSLKENPTLFHIPCENKECTNVIVTNSFLNVSIPQYCKECQKKEGVRP